MDLPLFCGGQLDYARTIAATREPDSPVEAGYTPVGYAQPGSDTGALGALFSAFVLTALAPCAFLGAVRYVQMTTGARSSADTMDRCVRVGAHFFCAMVRARARGVLWVCAVCVCRVCSVCSVCRVPCVHAHARVCVRGCVRNQVSE